MYVAIMFFVIDLQCNEKKYSNMGENVMYVFLKKEYTQCNQVDRRMLEK
jgi:hypothetical protein